MSNTVGIPIEYSSANCSSTVCSFSATGTPSANKFAVGSFQELLMSAASGSLPLNGNVSSEFLGGTVSADCTTLYKSSSDEIDDDGYLGGQECADGYIGGDSDSENEIDMNNGQSCTESEEENGWDIECDDKECESEDIAEGHVPDFDNAKAPDTGCSKINIGGCGCISTEDGNGCSDAGEDGLSDDSGSVDSDDEDDISIEIDLNQEIYADQAQLGSAYRKRKRAPKNDVRPNCRKPREMGAIERALRSASKRKKEHIFKPIIGMVFDSRQEAREFYNMYSWEVGFGVKYDASRPGSRNASKAKIDGEEGYRSMQEIVCQKSGADSRTTTGTKRCGCPAKIRLLRTDDHGWYISFHERTDKVAQHKLRKNDEVIYSRNPDAASRKRGLDIYLQLEGGKGEAVINNTTTKQDFERILDNWAKDVSNATNIAREAMLGCFKCRNCSGGEETTRLSASMSGGLGNIFPVSRVPVYIDLESDGEVYSADASSSVHPEKDTMNSTVTGDISEGQRINSEEGGGWEIMVPGDVRAIEENMKGSDMVTQNYGDIVISTMSALEIVDNDGISTAEDGGDIEGCNGGGNWSPKPICVIRDGASDMASYCTRSEECDDLVVPVTFVDTNSRFGISPFTLNLAHVDVPVECQLALDRRVRGLSETDKGRPWFIHRMEPVIEIVAEALNLMFVRDYDLSISAMNAVVRLFQEMDGEMYAHWSEKRWRHFLPADFAVLSINGLSNGAGFDFQELGKMFQGPNIPYNVSDCRMIFVPLMVDWYWALYGWDFERKRVVVLDPLKMNERKEDLDVKHSKGVSMLHHSMCECMNKNLQNNDVNENDWETDYVVDQGASCESENTGIYTVFYARYFDGTYLTRILTKDACRMQKINILYQLLAMMGNEGEPPSGVREGVYKRLIM